MNTEKIFPPDGYRILKDGEYFDGSAIYWNRLSGEWFQTSYSNGRWTERDYYPMAVPDERYVGGEL